MIDWLIREPKNFTEHIKSFIHSNKKESFTKVVTLHRIIQNFLWNGLDIIFYSSSNPTKHFQIDTTRPKLLKDCIKAVIHSSRKKTFLNKLSLYSRISKNFGILFYILGNRLLVLKQAWAELNQAKSILHTLFFDQWKYEISATME